MAKEWQRSQNATPVVQPDLESPFVVAAFGRRRRSGEVEGEREVRMTDVEGKALCSMNTTRKSIFEHPGLECVFLSHVVVCRYVMVHVEEPKGWKKAELQLYLVRQREDGPRLEEQIRPEARTRRAAGDWWESRESGSLAGRELISCRLLGAPGALLGLL